jgi:hypothetical protein
MYLGAMSPRSRIVAFGSAGTLVIVGVLCAVLVPGLTGQLLALVLLSVGLGGAVLLVFFEVGLSEDREREQKAERRGNPSRSRPKTHPRRRPTRTPRRRS